MNDQRLRDLITKWREKAIGGYDAAAIAYGHCADELEADLAASESQQAKNSIPWFEQDFAIYSRMEYRKAVIKRLNALLSALDTKIRI